MQYLMAIVIGAGAGFLAFCLFAPACDWLRSRRLVMMSAAVSEDERRFRAVFSIMSEANRLSLINYYMQKHGCSRSDAMRFAVENRERDSNRW